MNIFEPQPEETEREEIARRAKDNQKLIEKRACEMLALAGDNYEKRIGPIEMEKIESQHKALIQAWGRIMGSSIRMNIHTIEAMQIILGNIPLVIGQDILQRPQMIELQDQLSAMRNRMLKQIRAKAEQLSTHINSDNKNTGI